MEITTSESSGASTGAVEAAPASPAPSTSVTDAGGNLPAQPASSQIQGGETVTADQGEFPDEQAFLQLQGAERAENWKRARARIGELNGKVEELSGLQSHKPTIEAIDNLGGWERVQPLAELAGGLFSPRLDDHGQQVLNQQTGLPEYTAAPFVKNLAEQSPSTLWDVVLSAFDTPYGNETFGHYVLRERLGLDPGLLSTYRQISSPRDAAQYIVRNGGVDPSELEGIDPAYHDAYRSFTLQQREAFQGLGMEAQDQWLEERKELLETRKFREEQKAQIEESKRVQQAEWQRQIQQKGEALLSQVHQNVIDAAMQKLKAEAVFFADQADNQIAWDDAIQYGIAKVQKDPSLQGDLSRFNELYRLTAYYEATQDTWKAKQSRVEADKLAKKLEGRFGNYVTERVGWWSAKVAGGRSAHQQQVKDAQPRIEIGSPGSTSNGNQNGTAATPPPGQRFGYGDPTRIAQMAAQLAARKVQQGG